MRGKVELAFFPGNAGAEIHCVPARGSAEPTHKVAGGLKGEAWMLLHCWFKDLMKTLEMSSKEPHGDDSSLENVQSGQCPILAEGTLPYAFLT